MTFPKATEIAEANLHRTRYLLQNYPRFKAQCPEEVGVRTSQAVMEILSFSAGSKDSYSPDDVDLMNRCGYLLAPAIRAAANEIREFPVSISTKVYPVLYHMYFHPDGTAVDENQLLQRLTVEGDYTSEKVREYLSVGEKMMSALLFQCKYTMVSGLCA